MPFASAHLRARVSPFHISPIHSHAISYISLIYFSLSLRLTRFSARYIIRPGIYSSAAFAAANYTIDIDFRSMAVSDMPAGQKCDGLTCHLPCRSSVSDYAFLRLNDLSIYTIPISCYSRHYTRSASRYLTSRFEYFVSRFLCILCRFSPPPHFRAYCRAISYSCEAGDATIFRFVYYFPTNAPSVYADIYITISPSLLPDAAALTLATTRRIAHLL